MKELIGVLMVAAALWCVFDKYFIVLTGKKYNARVISSGDHTTRSAQRLEKATSGSWISMGRRYPWRSARFPQARFRTASCAK